MSNFQIVMPKLGESIQEGTITKWFVKEGDFITSISSFHKQKPSEHYIDALEDCVIISINRF